jgi:hypothetical protein
MATQSVVCPVLGGHITLLTDFEGSTTQVICPEYEESNGTCRLKKSSHEGGPLSEFLERVREDTLNTRSARCIFRR